MRTPPSHGVSLSRSAGGHGIGKMFHTNPNILHHKNDVNNGIMELGHTFTIEPLICEGAGEFLVFVSTIVFPSQLISYLARFFPLDGLSDKPW